MASRTINFTLENYEELGQIKELVERASQPLALDLIDIENITNGVNANLNIGNATQPIVNTILNSSGTVGKFITTVQQGISTAKSIAKVLELQGTEALNAEVLNTVRGLINSPVIDLDSLSQELDNLKNSLETFNSFVNSPINVQSNSGDDIAVVLDREIRADVINTIADINSSLKIFATNDNNIDSLINGVASYQNRLSQLAPLIGDYIEELSSILRFSGAFPQLQGFIGSLIFLEDDIRKLNGQATSILSEAFKFKRNLNSREVELEGLKDYFDGLLSLELDFPTEWNAGADVPSDRRYQIVFQGNRNLPNTIEIEGRFLLGELLIRNNRSLGSGSIAEPTIDFFLTRTVNDPNLGSITTTGNTQLKGFYQATINTEDRGESADIVRIPDLDIDIRVFEDETYSPLRVYARYDSPLRIVAIEPAPDAEGGFITPLGEEDFIDPIDILGTLDSDTLFGTNQDNAIAGLRGEDTLRGFGGNDLLSGGDDSDFLRGDNGNDTLNGGNGNDTLRGSTGDDLINGGDGNDFIKGDRDRDTINGGSGDDFIEGNGHDDVLEGGAGNDSLIGGGGNDTIRGGEGNDSLKGNAGSDLFVLAIGEGSDIVSDFRLGLDKIGLVAGLTFDDLTFAGNDIISGNETLVSLNISAESLSQEDFQVI